MKHIFDFTVLLPIVILGFIIYHVHRCFLGGYITAQNIFEE